MSIKLFFSYSHSDEPLRNELEKHLSLLKRNGVISTWHDRRITPGAHFDGQIDDNIRDSDLILLLVSSDFIASDYCYEVEMKLALSRHRNQEASVLPVILRPCDWQDAPFGNLLATPTDGRPVTKFPNIDDGFLEVVESVKRIAGDSQSTIPNTHVEDVEPPESKEKPRSSNLRVKRTFSQLEKHRFLTECFEYMASFFEESLAELSRRNNNLDTTFRRIDSNQFSATIYDGGNEVSSCTIRFGADGFATNGIYYSQGQFGGRGYNESLDVDSDGYSLFLKPTMGMTYLGVNKLFNQQGASEYYWQKLIESLQ